MMNDIKLPNKKVYFGFAVNPSDDMENENDDEGIFCDNCNTKYKYNFKVFSRLGDYYCENCDSKRPDLNYRVEEINELLHNHSSIIINGESINSNQSGLYNIYNIVCAFACASELDIDIEDIKNGIQSYQSRFGRQEIINIDDKEVEMILVKNPAGCNEAINKVALDDDTIDLGFLLNDNTGDGTDISWIWDVNFEKFKDVEYANFLIGGTRLYDMGIRLKVSGLDQEKLVLCDTYDKVLDTIKNSGNNKLYLLVTYSAMMEFRKFLYNNKYVRSIW